MSDLRYALRFYARNARFTTAVVLTLALSIGATSAMFAVVHSVLLRPLPYPEPDRLVAISEIDAGGRSVIPSDPNFDDLREQGRHVFAHAAQYASGTAAVVVGTEALPVRTASVSAEFFDAIGIAPAVGRRFLPDELQPGAARVVVVSHAFWQRHLQSSDLSRATLRVGTDVYRVVGVMPPDFTFPGRAEAWAPREQSRMRSGRTGHNYEAVGRLKPGVTLDQARRDLGAAARRLKQTYGEDTSMVDVALVPLREDLVGTVRPTLRVLFAAVAFLLIVGAANVLNLLLAQIVSRQREVAVRAALGAGRLRLVRQYVLETWMLAALGSALGLVLASWTIAWVRTLEPQGIPRLQELTVGSSVFLFALGLSLALGVVLGAVIAIRATGRNIWTPLGAGRGTSESPSRHRLRGTLLATQVALTLVLLVGAGLLARSLLRLLDINPGFRISGVATVRLHLPPVSNLRPLAPPAETDPPKAERARLLEALVARASTLPGVNHAGLISVFPLTGGGGNGTFAVLRGERPQTFADLQPLFRDPSRVGHAQYRIASEDYFRAAAIPLVRGRLFDARDTLSAPHVAVISETLARTRWPNADPIGEQIEFGNMDGDLRPFTVVGIVGDVRDAGLHAPPRSIIYANFRQRSQFGQSLVMHTDGDPAALAAPSRAALQGLAPEMPTRFQTAHEMLADAMSERHAVLLLIGAFAAMALLLSVSGLYGALSYSVTQQTREIGIRAALGAREAQVVGLVLRQGLTVVGVGVAVGAAVAASAARVLRTHLFGVEPTDPATLLAASGLLALVAFVACYLPARRASRVDPVVALRTE